MMIKREEEGWPTKGGGKGKGCVKTGQMPFVEARAASSTPFNRKHGKGDNDNFCLRLWELWMPDLKYLSTAASGSGTS